MPTAQVLQFPLAAGIDEGSDPKQLPPGKLLSLKNSQWLKDGMLDSRSGTRSLTNAIVGGGTLSAGARGFTRGTELLVIDGSNLYSYTAAGWVLRANLAEVGLTWSTILDAFDGVSASDVGLTSDGILVNAWITGDPSQTPTSNVFWQKIDRANGSKTTTPVQLDQSATAKNIRVLTSLTDYIVIWTTGANLKCSVNGAVPVTLRTDVATSGAFDACIIGSFFVVAYAVGAGGISLRSYSIANTPVQQASDVVTGETATIIPAISIDGNALDTLYIGYIRGNATIAFKIACANPTTLAQTLAPTNVDTTTPFANITIAVMRLDSSSCVYAYSNDGGSGGAFYVDGCVVTKKITSAGVLSGERRTFNMKVLSRPFLMNGTPYMFMANYANASGIITVPPITNGFDSFLVAIETNTLPIYVYPHRLVGKVDLLIAGNWSNGNFANVVPVSSTEFLTVLPFQATAATAPIGWRQGLRLVSATIGASRPADLWRPATYGPETYLSGGIMQAYDGREAFDYGMQGPAHVAVLTPATVGGAMATGSYLYTTVPEYRSAAGVLHRGPPATTRSVSVTGPTGQVTLSIVQPHLSFKSASSQAGSGVDPLRVLLAVYRSLVNGTNLRRLTYEPNSSVLYMQPGSDPATLVDTFADSQVTGYSSLGLGTRPLLYTDGGILEDYSPVASITHRIHRDRFWMIAGDRTTVWFSKSFQDDIGTAPGFHPNFRLVFDSELVGLESLDENLIVFGKSKIYVVDGEGPGANGQGATLRVTPLQTDVGCVNAASIVSMPDGVMFESARGIYIITRKLEVIWIGKPIRDRLAAYPTITSAVLVPGKNCVRFTANNAGATSGIVLVYDYLTRQWGTFEYYDADTGNTATPIVSAWLTNGVYSFLTPTGRVYLEDTTTYLDNGTTFVPQSWELAWVSADGPVGWQRVRRAFILGDRYTDCDVRLSFGFDHSSSYAQLYVWTSDKLAQFNDGVNIGMRVGSQNGAHPRCRAFRVRFETQSPTGAGAVLGNGRGVNVSMVGMEIVPRPSMDRRSARARA